MLVSDYNYDLPDERIAKFPPKERGSTRLLVLNRKTGAIQDSHYRDLADFLAPGDVLILNDTRVMQSRLFCALPDGRERELVVLEKHGDEPQRVMYRGKLHEGDILTVNPTRENHNHGSENLNPESRNLNHDTKNLNPPFNRGEKNLNLEIENHKVELPEHNIELSNHNLKPENHNLELPKLKVEKILGNGIAEIESKIPLEELAEQYGTVPLPPYLHRDATESDKKRYQTVWAKNMGSAAAPTASLNMTNELLRKLREKGIKIQYLTLHVGLGTFLPMRSDKVEDHHMHSEWFNIPPETLAAIEAAKAAGNKVVAVGTTVARTLEFYAKTGKTTGEDDIFIYPGFEFKILDALVTNFHAPKSTVLMLASAFASWDYLHAAYDYAVREKYNFLSYGDSMLIC